MPFGCTPHKEQQEEVISHLPRSDSNARAHRPQTLLPHKEQGRKGAATLRRACSKPMNRMKNWENSLYRSFGTLDGPGIRFVVFLIGCYLRCKFCHNIDVVLCKILLMNCGRTRGKILRNKPYLDASGGGVTVSGGEPFFQTDFLEEFLEKCHENGIPHCCRYLSQNISRTFRDAFAKHTDLFLISLKHFDDSTHRFLTGRNKDILENIRQLSAMKNAFWFRYVILQGYRRKKIFLHSHFIL